VSTRAPVNVADGSFHGHQSKEASMAHPDKLVIAEHSINQGHHIRFHNSFILVTNTRYIDHIVKEAFEIALHP
jgi:hypothetical protein